MIFKRQKINRTPTSWWTYPLSIGRRYAFIVCRFSLHWTWTFFFLTTTVGDENSDSDSDYFCIKKLLNVLSCGCIGQTVSMEFPQKALCGPFPYPFTQTDTDCAAQKRQVCCWAAELQSFQMELETHWSHSSSLTFRTVVIGGFTAHCSCDKILHEALQWFLLFRI